MTYEEAAKLVAHHAALLGQVQRLKDAQADSIAALERALQNLEPLMRMARTVLDDHCRNAEKVVKLRPSIQLPAEREQ